MIKKFSILTILLFLFTISNNAHANKFQVKDLEIKLFDKNKLIKSSRAIREGFGKVEIKAFAKKIDDQNVGPIILVVYSKVDKYGMHIRNFFEEYFFKNNNAIFNKDDAYHYKLNEKKNSYFQVSEFNLEKFIKRSDDFIEIRSALKGLYKKNSLENNDRVLKSDHFYLKSNGNMVWVSYMFNYETVIKENYFQSGKSKFHPTNINEFPRFKIYMDKWSNLAFKRHHEFQEKLKVKNKIDLVLDGFDNKLNLDFYENAFFSSNINENQFSNSENERKAKEEKERKAKEETSKSKGDLSVGDLMSKIKELNEMYKSGVISKDEFEILKNKLLNN